MKLGKYMTKTVLFLALVFVALIMLLVFVVPKCSGKPLERIELEVPGGFKGDLHYGPSAIPSPGDSAPAPLNNPPQVVTISLVPSIVRVKATAVVSVDAKDLEGDSLAYLFVATRGNVRAKGWQPEPQTTYEAPDTSGLDTIKVTAADTASNQANLSLTFFVYDEATKETATHLSSGLVSLSIGDYPKAVLLLNSVIQDSPDLYPAYVYRGYAFSQIKDWDRAIEDYSAFLNSNPESQGVYLLRAQAYLLSGVPQAKEKAALDIDSFLKPTLPWSIGPLQPFAQLRTDAERLQWLESAIRAAPKELWVLSKTGLYPTGP